MSTRPPWEDDWPAAEKPPWEDDWSGDEPKFRAWYGSHAKKLGLSPDPDDPEHQYDYRAAFKAGAKPDASGHWPSQFKRDGHPRLIVDGTDTRTGKRVRPEAVSLDELHEKDYENRGMLEKGAEAIAYPFGLPKRGVDALARATARAIGINVDDEATTGKMLRQAAGMTPEYQSDLEANPERGGMKPSADAFNVAGRAVEFAGDIGSDPLTWLMGGAGTIARSGRAAEATLGVQSPAAAAKLAEIVGGVGPTAKLAETAAAGHRAEIAGRAAAGALAPSMAAGAGHSIAKNVDNPTAEGVFETGVETAMALATGVHAGRGRKAPAKVADKPRTQTSTREPLPDVWDKGEVRSDAEVRADLEDARAAGLLTETKNPLEYEAPEYEAPEYEAPEYKRPAPFRRADAPSGEAAAQRPAARSVRNRSKGEARPPVPSAASVTPTQRWERAIQAVDEWTKQRVDGADVAGTFEEAERRAGLLEREIAAAEKRKAPSGDLSMLRSAKAAYEGWSSEREPSVPDLPEDVGGTKSAPKLTVFEQLTADEQRQFPRPTGGEFVEADWLKNDVNERFPTVEAARAEAERLRTLKTEYLTEKKAREDAQFKEQRARERERLAREGETPEQTPAVATEEEIDAALRGAANLLREGKTKKNPAVALDSPRLEGVSGKQLADLIEKGGDDPMYQTARDVMRENIENQKELEATASILRPKEPKPEPARAAKQGKMFGGEMLQGTEKNVPEGREAKGPLFTQEQDAAAAAEAASQESVPFDVPEVSPEELAREAPRSESQADFLGIPTLARMAGRAAKKAATVVSEPIRELWNHPGRPTIRTFETQLRRMGTAGGGVAATGRRYEHVWESREGRDVSRFDKAIGGVANKQWLRDGVEHEKLWRDEVVPILQGKLDPSKASEAGRNSASRVRAILDDIYERADEKGVPVAPYREDYFPVILKDPKTFKSPEAAAQRLVEYANKAGRTMSIEDAREYLAGLENQFRKGGRVFGPLERERNLDWPEDMRRFDPDALREWISKAHRRIAEVEILGRRHENIDAWINRLPDQKQRHMVREQIKILTGLHDRTWADEVSAKTRAFVAVTRLFKGPISQISTLGQTAYGVGGPVKGPALVAREFWNVATGGKGAKGLTDLRNNIINAQIDARKTGAIHAQIAGEFRDILSGGSTPWWAPWVGWTADVDTMQRVVASRVGRNVAADLIRSARKGNRGDAKILDQMRVPWKPAKRGEMALDPENLSEAQLDSFGKRFSDYTQRRTGVFDTPVAVSGPVGRAAFNLSNFAYQQTRLVRDALVAHDPKRMATLASGFVVMGGLVGIMKAAAEGYSDQTKGSEKIDLYGLDWKDWHSYDILIKELRKASGIRQVKMDSPEGVLYRVLQMAAQSGGFGLAQSAIERVTHSEDAGELFWTMATGPAGQSALDVVGKPLAAAAKGDWDAAALALSRGVTEHLPYGRQIEQEVVEQSTFGREVLGAKTDRPATAGHVGRALDATIGKTRQPDEPGPGAAPGDRDKVRKLRDVTERATRSRDDLPEEITERKQRPLSERVAQKELDLRRRELQNAAADAIENGSMAAARQAFAQARRERVPIRLSEIKRKLAGQPDPRAERKHRALIRRLEALEQRREEAR